MALDYYLEIENYGSKDKTEKLRGLFLENFLLSERKETGLLVGDGLSIGFFIDGDISESNNTTPYLTVNFRIEKIHSREQGYILLRSIIQKLTDTIEEDFRVIDEDENIFMKRESNKVLKMLTESDIWKIGV